MALQGNYTIKSGYIIAHRVLHASSSSSTSSSVPDGLWKRLWNIYLLSKLSVFLWMALKNHLSCNELMNQRILSVDPSCKWCGEIDSIIHCFFLCPWATAVWINSPLRLQSLCLPQSNIKTCWNELIIFFEYTS